MLVLSTDGLYRVFSEQHVADRILELRSEGHSLGTIAEKIIDECMKVRDGARRCKDNVTLVIVNLKEYFQSYRRQGILKAGGDNILQRQRSACDPEEDQSVASGSNFSSSH